MELFVGGLDGGERVGEDCAGCCGGEVEGECHGERRLRVRLELVERRWSGGSVDFGRC